MVKEPDRFACGPWVICGLCERWVMLACEREGTDPGLLLSHQVTIYEVQSCTR